MCNFNAICGGRNYCGGYGSYNYGCNHCCGGCFYPCLPARISKLRPTILDKNSNSLFRHTFVRKRENGSVTRPKKSQIKRRNSKAKKNVHPAIKRNQEQVANIRLASNGIMGYDSMDNSDQTNGFDAQSNSFRDNMVTDLPSSQPSSVPINDWNQLDIQNFEETFQRSNNLLENDGHGSNYHINQITKDNCRCIEPRNNNNDQPSQDLNERSRNQSNQFIPNTQEGSSHFLGPKHLNKQSGLMNTTAKSTPSSCCCPKPRLERSSMNTLDSRSSNTRFPSKESKTSDLTTQKQRGISQSSTFNQYSEYTTAPTNRAEHIQSERNFEKRQISNYLKDNSYNKRPNETHSSVTPQQSGISPRCKCSNTVCFKDIAPRKDRVHSTKPDNRNNGQHQYDQNSKIKMGDAYNSTETLYRAKSPRCDNRGKNICSQSNSNLTKQTNIERTKKKAGSAAARKRKESNVTSASKTKPHFGKKNKEKTVEQKGALVKYKPKKSKKLSRKSVHKPDSSIGMKPTQNEGIWLECNLPIRVHIPTTICIDNLCGLRGSSQVTTGNNNCKAIAPLGTTYNKEIDAQHTNLGLMSKLTICLKPTPLGAPTDINGSETAVAPAASKSIKKRGYKGSKKRVSIDSSPLPRSKSLCEATTQTCRCANSKRCPKSTRRSNSVSPIGKSVNSDTTYQLYDRQAYRMDKNSFYDNVENNDFASGNISPNYLKRNGRSVDYKPIEQEQPTVLSRTRQRIPQIPSRIHNIGNCFQCDPRTGQCRCFKRSSRTDPRIKTGIPEEQRLPEPQLSSRMKTGVPEEQRLLGRRISSHITTGVPEEHRLPERRLSSCPKTVVPEEQSLPERRLSSRMKTGVPEEQHLPERRPSSRPKTVVPEEQSLPERRLSSRMKTGVPEEQHLPERRPSSRPKTVVPEEQSLPVRRLSSRMKTGLPEEQNLPERRPSSRTKTVVPEEQSFPERRLSSRMKTGVPEEQHLPERRPSSRTKTGIPEKQYLPERQPSYQNIEEPCGSDCPRQSLNEARQLNEPRALNKARHSQLSNNSLHSQRQSTGEKSALRQLPVREQPQLSAALPYQRNSTADKATNVRAEISPKPIRESEFDSKPQIENNLPSVTEPARPPKCDCGWGCDFSSCSCENKSERLSEEVGPDGTRLNKKNAVEQEELNKLTNYQEEMLYSDQGEGYAHVMARQYKDGKTKSDCCCNKCPTSITTVKVPINEIEADPSNNQRMVLVASAMHSPQQNNPKKKSVRKFYTTPRANPRRSLKKIEENTNNAQHTNEQTNLIHTNPETSTLAVMNTNNPKTTHLWDAVEHDCDCCSETFVRKANISEEQNFGNSNPFLMPEINSDMMNPSPRFDAIRPICIPLKEPLCPERTAARLAKQRQKRNLNYQHKDNEIEVCLLKNANINGTENDSFDQEIDDLVGHSQKISRTGCNEESLPQCAIAIPFCPECLSMHPLQKGGTEMTLSNQSGQEASNAIEFSLVDTNSDDLGSHVEETVKYMIDSLKTSETDTGFISMNTQPQSKWTIIQPASAVKQGKRVSIHNPEAWIEILPGEESNVYENVHENQETSEMDSKNTLTLLKPRRLSSEASIKIINKPYEPQPKETVLIDTRTACNLTDMLEACARPPGNFSRSQYAGAPARTQQDRPNPPQPRHQAKLSPLHGGQKQQQVGYVNFQVPAQQPQQLQQPQQSNPHIQFPLYQQFPQYAQMGQHQMHQQMQNEPPNAKYKTNSYWTEPMEVVQASHVKQPVMSGPYSYGNSLYPMQYNMMMPTSNFSHLNSYSCNSGKQMPNKYVQHIPVGFYQQTVAKYGIEAMDSYFNQQFENRHPSESKPFYPQQQQQQHPQLHYHAQQEQL